MAITPINQPEAYISHFEWIKACNFTAITPEVVLARCILGQYFGYIGTKEGKVVSMVICEDCGDMVFVVGLWAKNVLKDFLGEFKILMKHKGYKTFRASTNLNEEAYKKLLGMKKLWAVYEGDL